MDVHDLRVLEPNEAEFSHFWLSGRPVQKQNNFSRCSRIKVEFRRCLEYNLQSFHIKFQSNILIPSRNSLEII